MRARRIGNVFSPWYGPGRYILKLGSLRYLAPVQSHATFAPAKVVWDFRSMRAELIRTNTSSPQTTNSPVVDRDVTGMLINSVYEYEVLPSVREREQGAVGRRYLLRPARVALWWREMREAGYNNAFIEELGMRAERRLQTFAPPRPKSPFLD